MSFYMLDPWLHQPSPSVQGYGRTLQPKVSSFLRGGVYLPSHWVGSVNSGQWLSLAFEFSIPSHVPWVGCFLRVFCHLYYYLPVRIFLDCPWMFSNIRYGFRWCLWYLLNIRCSQIFLPKSLNCEHILLEYNLNADPTYQLIVWQYIVLVVKLKSLSSLIKTPHLSDFSFILGGIFVDPLDMPIFFGQYFFECDVGVSDASSTNLNENNENI